MTTVLINTLSGVMLVLFGSMALLPLITAGRDATDQANDGHITSIPSADTMDDAPSAEAA